jgi:hypothetical protein
MRYLNSLQPRSDSNRGLTRTDLLATLAVLTPLVLIQFAALGNNRVRIDATVCLSNFRRLAQAWQLYTDDNNGRLVLNNHGGGLMGTSQSPVNWARGWLDWALAPDNTNALLLIDDRWSRLGGYCGRSAEVFKCPADPFLSVQQRSRGWTARVRSVSGNIGIGDGNAENGPWDPIYKHIKTVSEFIHPGPSETWVYLEEHPDSINDTAFFNPYSSTWIDIPAVHHHGATALGFADGHAELHRWTDSLSSPSVQRVGFQFISPPVRTGDADVHWLSYRAGRVSERSY